MTPPKTAPTGLERTFGEDELIVTKTDTKGIIRYANPVFLTISALQERDALGQPHNIIRHPDMPRCVFKLMWDRISAGQELFAYVLNLAADGAHYWVYAHITPSFGRRGEIIGYHSNRRCPDRHGVAAAEQVYARLLAEERRHARPADAIAASAALFESILVERGQDYDEWVWDLTTSGAGALR